MSIEPEVLQKADRSIRSSTLMAVFAGVLSVLAVVAGATGGSPAVAAVVATLFFVLACIGVASLVHHRMVREVGRAHDWRQEQAEVGVAGRSEHRRVRITIPNQLGVLEPVEAWSNTSSLMGHTELEVAGEPTGRLLVRIPGEGRIQVFAPVHP